MSAGPLVIDGVGFGYADGATILDGVSLSVREGEFVSLLGPSGSGKSTLLRLVAGLERPGRGTISWQGRPVAGAGPERAVVFQNYALFPWYRIADLVAQAVGKARPALPKAEHRRRAIDALAQVGLADAAGKYPFQLSGGMQQRVAIARALALESPVLLLDEPFGALDPVNRAKLQDLLLDVWQASSPRRTILFVTHDVDEALYLGDRVAVLGASPGHLVAECGIPFARPRDRRALLADPRFHALRERIAERLDADFLAGLAAA